MSVSLNNLNNPVSIEREWISVKNQEKRFRVHKAADVYLGLGKKLANHRLFDAHITGMIADYANNDKWSIACKLLGQAKILAFPEEHMSEIGSPDSVFYFIPAGSLNQFEARLNNCAHEVLGIQGDHPLKFRYFNTGARQEHGNTPHDAKWALMKRELLEGSRSKTYQEHVDLAVKKGIRIPAIQTVIKILLADKLLQLATLKKSEAEETKDDLEAVKAEKTLFPIGTYTRVIQQTTFGCHLVIGGLASSGMSVSSSYDGYYDGYIGLAALREF